MDKDKQLSNPVPVKPGPEQRGCRLGSRAKPYSNRTVRLGNAVGQLFESRISPQHARFESIDELWSRLLPVELHRHCKIADISGGQLKVLVDSSPYLYELQLCSSEILAELKRRCPQARIKKIRFTIGLIVK